MTAHIPNATAAMGAAIDATDREQGDPMPTAEELIGHLRDRGYTVLPRPDAARLRPAGFQEHMDRALAGAKAAFDHADAQHHPDALALIRAAETMYEHLFGDRADEATADLLIAYTYWLNEKQQLVKGDNDHTDELDDVALHFLAERRENAARTPGAGTRAYMRNWAGADADDEVA